MPQIGPPRANYEGLSFGPNWAPVANWSRSYSRQSYQFVAGASGNYFSGATARECHSVVVRRFNAACTKISIGWGAFAYGTDVGNDITIAAAVLEYPSGSGSFYDITFGGSTTTIIPNGQVVMSDALSLPGAGAAIGDTFNIRTYSRVSADAYIHPIYGDKWTSDKTVYGTTVTDQTRTALASVVDTKAYGFGPCTILGNSGAAAIVLYGDSVMQGTGDSSTGPIDVGWASRGLNNTYGILNASRHGEGSLQFMSGYMKHRYQMVYSAQRAIGGYGNNDIHGGVEVTTPQSADRVSNTLLRVWRTFANRGIKNWQSTITPRTTSTDAWGTTANQTKNAN